MNKIRKIRITLFVSLIVLFQGCSTKNLSDTEVLGKAWGSCESSLSGNIIMPSHGFIGDMIAISSVKTTKLDGGFSNTFSSFINTGIKNIVVYCPNSYKIEAMLLNTLNSYKDNELNNISVCVIGMKNSKDLSNEANRTGTNIKFVP